MWGALGDPNASIPTPQPVLMRPTLVGADGADHAVTFVAPAALDAGLASSLGLRRRLVAVTPTRDVGKADMVNNDALPAIDIDPETFAITVEGELVDARRPPPRCRWRSSTRCSDDAPSPCSSPTRGCPSPATPSPGASSPRSPPGPTTSRPTSPCASRTVTRTEAATAVVTLAHLRRGEGLDAVYDAWAARTASAAMRDTSRELGRGLLRLADALWDLPPTLSGLPRPMVLGAIAHATGLAAADVAEVVGYDDLQTVASAALKLRPLDPAVATGWVVAALPRLAALVSQVARPRVTHRHPRHRITVDRAARRGPRRHHQEVVPCLRVHASSGWASAAPSAPASPR